MRKALFIIMLLLPAILFSPTEEKQDIWQPFRFFIGSWEGAGEGMSGTSKLEAYFKFVLKEKYIEARYSAVFPPNDKNPKGEVHEDFGFFSYDRYREKLVYRQFNIEGNVNQFVFHSISPDGKTIVFISESIENLSPGWRAKITYKIMDDNEFNEIFELAAPEKDFQICVKNHLKRKK